MNAARVALSRAVNRAIANGSPVFVNVAPGSHAYYNRQNFPRFVCHHGNWDICANAAGYCAAIPTETGAADGCNATHFGDAAYLRATLGVEVKL